MKLAPAPLIALILILSTAPGPVAVAQPWCPAVPDTPYPAPTWEEIGPVPNYVAVSENVQLDESLQLLVSVLEKALARLEDGSSLAGQDDVDGRCVCRCGRSAEDLQKELGNAVADEVPAALRETRDAYLKSLRDAFSEARSVVTGAAPAFRQEVETILRNACPAQNPPDICTPGKNFGATVEKEIDVVLGGQITRFEALFQSGQTLSTEMRDLIGRIDQKITDLENGTLDPVATALELPGLLQDLRDLAREAEDLLDDLETEARSLKDAFANGDPQTWADQVLVGLGQGVSQDSQTLFGTLRPQLEQALETRVAEIRDAAQTLYDTVVDYEGAFDTFRQTVLERLAGRLASVDGCYGVTKRSQCNAAGFCDGQQELAWFPTEVFQDGKTTALFALELVGWLDDARAALDKAMAPKAVAGKAGKKLVELLKKGQEILATFYAYVDHFSDGYHLGAYSQIRPDLHMCVGYAGHGVLAELLDVGKVRGGAGYLSANLSERHRAQFRSGGFTLVVNDKKLPLAPGLSLNLQMDGFRLWDRYDVFGIGAKGSKTPTFNGDAALDTYDVFNLADRDALCALADDPSACNLTPSSFLYRGFYPIEYVVQGAQRQWPRSHADLEWERDHPLAAVLGAGLQLPFSTEDGPQRGQNFFEIDTQRWDGPSFLLFPGATLSLSLTLDAGFGWLYQGNYLRGTLVEQLNANSPGLFSDDDFARLAQPLQAPDVTEDVGHAAFVRPTVTADLDLGLKLGKRFKVGVTASLHLGIDVEVGGYGGLLDLKRPFFDALAESNPKPGPGGELDCEPIIEENLTTVCSSTIYREPEDCGEGEDCVLLGSGDGDGKGNGDDRPVSTGTYTCEATDATAKRVVPDHPACEERGYCSFAGQIWKHDAAREDCSVPIGFRGPEGTPSVAAAASSGELPVSTFHPYRCVDRREPEVTGWEGEGCHPLLVGFDAVVAAAVKDELDDGPHYTVASYALDRAIVTVLLGWSARIGLDYKLFRKWKSRELWSDGDTMDLLSEPLVKFQMGLEAPYYDDCTMLPQGKREVRNHQASLIPRDPGGGTAFDLVRRCQPEMAEDVSDPQMPEEDVGGLVSGTMVDIQDFGLEMSKEQWNRGQICIGGQRWDAFFQGLKTTPDGIWKLTRCGYRDGGRLLDLDCSGPAALESSLAAASGCLDTNRRFHARLVRALGNDIGAWTRQFAPTVGGVAADEPRRVFDLDALFPDPTTEDLWREINVAPQIRALLGPRLGAWLGALDQCTAGIDTRLEMQMDIGEPELCAGACCEGGTCRQVADPRSCNGAFSSGKTCSEVDACAAPPRIDPGICLTSGGCAAVPHAAFCSGVFVPGTTCATTDACLVDDDCADGEWCRRRLTPVIGGAGEVPSEAGTCRPRIPEGGRCNGLRDPFSATRCEEGLRCEWTGGGRLEAVRATCQPVCAPRPDRTVAWWPFESVAWSRTPDVLGRSPGRLLNGVAQTDGRVGQALTFDGIDDGLEIDDGPSVRFGRSDLSIAFWLRSDDNRPQRTILTKRDGRRGYQVLLHHGRPVLQLGDGGGRAFSGGVAVADGDWHFLAVTVDRDRADGVRWYVDGVPVGSAGDPRSVDGTLDVAAPLEIGGGDTGRPAAMALDELIFVRRAVGADEIRRLYRAAHEGICHCAPGIGNDAVAWWRFDSGPRRILDEIGDAHGTSTGRPVPADGAVGSALAFDGVDDLVDVPAASAQSFPQSFAHGDFTFEGWIRHLGGINTSAQSIVDTRVDEGRGLNLFVWRGRPGLQLQTHRHRNFVSDIDLSDGQWHHVAVTVDRDAPDGLRWYLDGSALGSAQNPTAFQGSLESAGGLRFGAITTTPASRYWKGELDELAVYDRALGAAEIEAIVRAGDDGKCSGGGD